MDISGRVPKQIKNGTIKQDAYKKKKKNENIWQGALTNKYIHKWKYEAGCLKGTYEAGCPRIGNIRQCAQIIEQKQIEIQGRVPNNVPQK